MNFHGSTLFCINDVGLYMCIEQCYKTEGCNFVNYDRGQLYCDLMFSDQMNETDFISETNKVVAAVGHIVSVSRLKTELQVKTHNQNE